ncbi:hypothetical protein COLO4_19356 [Corchorus olitorius]|uniref:Uncharacterized protein n=1 Tax=Corchorus olitorius TaxID=93759 RepID=A0A1R3J5L9_9ROSI|nr:hypothetical protein COLO4_19356 [Corchorus olitorius]
MIMAPFKPLNRASPFRKDAKYRLQTMANTNARMGNHNARTICGTLFSITYSPQLCHWQFGLLQQIPIPNFFSANPNFEPIHELIEDWELQTLFIVNAKFIHDVRDSFMIFGSMPGVHTTFNPWWAEHGFTLCSKQTRTEIFNNLAISLDSTNLTLIMSVDDDSKPATPDTPLDYPMASDSIDLLSLQFALDCLRDSRPFKTHKLLEESMSDIKNIFLSLTEDIKQLTAFKLTKSSLCLEKMSSLALENSYYKNLIIASQLVLLLISSRFSDNKAEIGNSPISLVELKEKLCFPLD